MVLSHLSIVIPSLQQIFASLTSWIHSVNEIQTMNCFCLILIRIKIKFFVLRWFQNQTWLSLRELSSSNFPLFSAFLNLSFHE
jgi:hypothetical protein